MKLLFVWPRYSDPIFKAADPMKKFIKFFSKLIFIRQPLTFSILAALTPEKHEIETVEGELYDSHPFHAINCVAFPSRGKKRLSAF